MKKFFRNNWWLVALWLIAGVGFFEIIWNGTHPQPWQHGSKQIVAKETGVIGDRVHTETVYYLIAKDHTHISVSVGDWSLTQIGDWWDSDNWQK